MEAERGDNPCRLGFQGMETERGDNPCRLGFQGMEMERGDDPHRLEFQGMETERGDDLREAKRLKPSPATDAISFKSEEVPSTEMNMDVDRLDCDPVPSSEMDVDVHNVSHWPSLYDPEHSAMLEAISKEICFWDLGTMSKAPGSDEKWDLGTISQAPASDEKCVFYEDEDSTVESDDDYLIPTPDILQRKYILDRYKEMNLVLYNDDLVCKGCPETDKEYLFLFCELKGDPEKYQQVLSDMELVMEWKCSPFESIDCLNDSDDLSVPKSVIIAKQVIVENKLILGLSEILECFWDIYTEWRLQKEIFGYKMYEEFLLYFWEKNEREPTLAEIKDKFCQGYFPTENDDPSPKFCSLTTCLKPAPGKLCYRNMIYEVNSLRLGEELLEGLQKGCSRKQGLKIIIEECYKKRLSKPCYCRAHFLKSKLEEVVKSGLITEIRELFPSYDNVVVRSENLDIKVPIEQFDRSKVRSKNSDIKVPIEQFDRSKRACGHGSLSGPSEHMDMKLPTH